MRKAYLILAPLGLLLMAQSDAPEMLPGEWEVTTTILSVEFSDDAPEEMRAGMEEQMEGQETASSRCIPAGQLAERPEAILLEESNGCRFIEAEMGNGRVRGTALCGEGEELSGEVTVSGAYTATTFSEIATVSASSEVGDMTFRMKARGRRVGDCTAD